MSEAPKSEKIWLDGSLVDWDLANVHVMTHTLHYGMGVFEGIRCYKAQKGPAVFRLPEHTARLFASAKIVGMNIPYTQDQINKAILDTIRVNNLDECYIRPIAFLGDNRRGLNTTGVRTQVAVAVWRWGTYLGEEALAKGIRVKVASFARHHENVTMTKAKVCGAYVNSIMAKIEAVKAGYDEALLLDVAGHVAEGSGENIFIVRNGRLKTPPLTSVLEGITRDSVITIARDMGLVVEEQYFSRDEVYIADEAFFTGTAAELTPINSLDDRMIGQGGMGSVTRKLQTAYFDTLRGRTPEYENWLTYLA